MILRSQLRATPAASSCERRAVAESLLVSAIDAAVTLRHIQETHGRLLRLGFSDSCFLLSKLLRRLAANNTPMEPYPRLIFSQVPRPNSFLWTSLIRGYAMHGDLPLAFKNYAAMRRQNQRPLSFTFSALFKSCSVAKALTPGAQLHAQIISMGGFTADLYVHNTLLCMYVDCGELPLARKLFNEMSCRDVISWTCLIAAYSRSGDMDEAAELFDRAPEKDMVAWTAMISGFAQNARPRESLRFFRRMEEEGVKADEVTLVGVISACAQLGATAEAARISANLFRSGAARGSIVVGSALVDMYSKCGLIDEGRAVFKSMVDKNVYTYSAMIAGLAANGRAREAVDLFEEMSAGSSVAPNGVTFIGLLTACSHGRLVEEGRRYFAAMKERFKIKPTVDHYACMVDLLGRAGLLEEAYEMAKSVPEVAHGGVWGALLGACRIHGNAVVAEIAAEEVFKLEPEAIGNYAVLCNVYAQAGLWKKVAEVRKRMREKGLRKNPGCSVVETENGAFHEFFAGGGSHPRIGEIRAVLEELLERAKAAGYLPKLESVFYDVGDAEKERLLKGHSEKLALAFGILTTRPGNTIRIVKNLRVCEDCHSVMCFASAIAERGIVLRDNLRFHHFRDGSCSCGGFW